MRRRTIALAAALAIVAAQAQAETLKLAVPQRGSWGTSYADLGIRQGFFKAAGLDVEITYTEGGASNEQAVISGSVDIAIETGFLGIIASYVKGAPVRVISPASTGAPGSVLVRQGRQPHQEPQGHARQERRASPIPARRATSSCSSF